jgi:hypothetical protein
MRTWQSRAQSSDAASENHLKDHQLIAPGIGRRSRRCIWPPYFTHNLHRDGLLYTSAEFLARTTRCGLFLLLSESQSAQLVYKRVALLYTTWYTAVAGWNVKAWVPREKVARPEQQRHRLSRHDWEVFWTGEMCNAKCVPKNNVRVSQVGVWVRFDPRRNTL